MYFHPKDEYIYYRGDCDIKQRLTDRSASHFGRFAPQIRPMGCAICIYTDDIDSAYKILIENHVECLSEPQYFDFRAEGFGESRAFYFRDPDGIILEMMQPL